jgi:hypothetical protein
MSRFCSSFGSALAGTATARAKANDFNQMPRRHTFIATVPPNAVRLAALPNGISALH